ncbi:response regulator containing a CheY-like receiver domain and an HD-GYP domain [Polaromonas sp. CF318]|uniref:adenylate/guanylate cyclase domain-containing protein n=1 Tax=Polaromonas sp. CF318 TaxID=1144318 RepID=UPI0002711092|nr:adenylate/guanylate cyclase domain-containing protein [Polaromonas sp. CF318]EJL78226.1 response regulator containing a CheY-like receiver domain and an HD-GYP domain [Polaromonas sp. CF318]
MTEAVSEQDGPRPARRARVLVVDDTADVRFFLVALLRDDYEVEAAESGEEGLQVALSERRPEIILLDVMMPGMDGYEVMRRLARDSRTVDIPVIFLTALSSVEEEQFGLDLGATDYITKPISPPVLLARVRLHLERSANAKRLKTLSEQLSRYLAPQVYQSLFDGSRQAEIQTQRKRLTVFFSDIKNFTASTAQWQPEEVTFLLNSYFEEMSQIAAEYGATLDKFIGDAIVIFFGDPHTLGPRQDAVQCVKMAVAMQQRMAELRQRWKAMGIPKAFEIRIGINSGFCDVGNFGSNLRMDYTIIGREVNLAARLEQAAEPGGILISRDTHDLVQGDIEVEEREPVIAKGFSEPITVYAVRKTPAPSAAAGVIQCDRPGLRLELDPGRLTPAQRADAAAELRRALDSLEPAPQAGASAAAPASVPAPGADAGTQASRLAAVQAADMAGAGDETLPDSIAGINLTVGLSRAMNMKGFYISMLRRFMDGRADTPVRIREALAAGDLKAAELLSHSLRGVSAQIGATQLPQDAEALEQALRDSAPREGIDELLLRMEDSLGELMEALRSALPPPDPVKSP